MEDLDAILVLDATNQLTFLTMGANVNAAAMIGMRSVGLTIKQ